MAENTNVVTMNGTAKAFEGSDRSFWTGLPIQLRVMKAIMLRELSGRYGRENIGYLWMIGEPMMLATVITIIHLAQPAHTVSDGIQVAPFAILGYTVFIIFRGVFNKSAGSVEMNTNLFYHRNISLFDMMIARSVIEMVGCAATTFILMTIAIEFDLSSLPYRPLQLFVGIGLMCWFSFGCALVAASLTYKSETMERQMHVLSYFCIPISGAFFQLSNLPEPFQTWLSWFPMTLIFEQVRFGWFQSAPSRYVDPSYVVACCAVLTYAGILLLRRLRYKL